MQLRNNVPVCTDPNGDMFLECAALTHADYLITGDKALIAVGTYEGTSIVKPAEFLALTD